MTLKHSTCRWLILLLALAGAMRVAFFAAAYPPFLFIDEDLHFENVIKYARTGLPGRGDDLLDPGAARTWNTYGIHGPGAMEWETPEQRRQAIEDELARIEGCRNCETFTPPLYYALAASWHRAGQALGLRDPMTVYWLRWLNVPLYGLAIWLGGRLCLRFHPQRPELAVAAGIVLAAIPQDVLYTINSDAASPLAVTLALYLLLAWLQSPRRAVALAAAAGVAASAAMLVKYTNVAALAVIPVALLIRACRRRTSSAEVIALLLATGIPLAAWLAYCQIELGDWSATRDKAEMLGWTPLTWRESLRHPIFGPLGMIEFSQRLWVTFWRGELIWGKSIERVPAADAFYLVVSALALLGAIGWIVRPSAPARAERPMAAVYLVAVGVTVLFLALVSTRFDYGRCFFPSRGFPYFAAGRLMTGILVPFAILLVGSAQELLAFTRRRNAAIAFALIVAAVCLASELYLLLAPADGALTSRHNFYHLLLRRAG